MEYLNKSGLEYLWSKIKTILNGKRDKIIASKTYTGYFNDGANEANNRNVFCFKITRSSYYEPWRLKFRVTAKVPNHLTNGIYTHWEVDYFGYASNIKSYYCKVNHGATQALTHVTSAYPKNTTDNIVYLGFSASPMTNNYYNNSGYARDVTVDLLEYENCDVEILDDLLWWKNMTQSNYSEINIQLVDNGYQETSDEDYLMAHLGGNYYTKLPVHQYALCGLDANKDNIIPIAEGTSGTGTSKTPQILYGIHPENLYFFDSNEVNANTLIEGSKLYLNHAQLDLRYMMNWSSSLGFSKEDNLYLVGNIKSDGLFYVADVSSWITNKKSDVTKTYWQFAKCVNANGYTITMTNDNSIIWEWDAAQGAWKNRSTNSYDSHGNILKEIYINGSIDNSGNDGTDVSYNRTEHQQILSNKPLYFTRESQTYLMKIYYYTEDKKFISVSTVFNETDTALTSNAQLTSPDDAAYFRLQIPATVTDRISISYEQLSGYEPKQGINLTEVDLLQDGHLNADGTEASSTSQKRTGYIPIDSSYKRLYFFRTHAPYLLAAAFYDENKDPIIYSDPNARTQCFSSAQLVRTAYKNIPDDAVFVRFYVSAANYEGSVALSHSN